MRVPTYTCMHMPRRGLARRDTPLGCDAHHARQPRRTLCASAAVAAHAAARVQMYFQKCAAGRHIHMCAYGRHIHICACGSHICMCASPAVAASAAARVQSCTHCARSRTFAHACAHAWACACTLPRLRLRGARSLDLSLDLSTSSSLDLAPSICLSCPTQACCGVNTCTYAFPSQACRGVAASGRHVWPAPHGGTALTRWRPADRASESWGGGGL